MAEMRARVVPDQENEAFRVQSLFELQAEAKSDSIAVITDHGCVTYRDLNGRSNQLAHYLREMGVGPEVRVAIAMDRGIDLLTAILGVLKAGGAYLTLDPSHPEERLSYMLQDAAVSVVLTQHDLVDTLPNSMGLVISVDSARPTIDTQRDDNPAVATASPNIAYIIYTSGSTGAPKGVLIPHSGVGNTLRSAIKAWDIRSEDRVLQLYSFSFDASVMDLFMAISTGAALYLADKSVRFAGLELVQVVLKQAITVAKLPPSLLAYLPSNDLPCLREIISGGESVPPTVASRWADGRDFFCVYGPTEASIAASWYKVGALTSESKSVPIGRAIDNTSAYIVDREFKPAEFGDPGELLVSGAGLARGYLNCPDLTAERFLPDPFSPQRGVRMYKTGDLTSYNEDANIAFLGRTDNQVKIRGFRIEVGEIESALNEHRSVKDGVVVALDDQAGEKRLAAYVTPEAGQDCSAGELHRFLASRLPDYMIPSDFVVLTKFPLTPSGKVDRRSLPAPDRTRSGLESAYVAPSNRAEEILVGAWAQILSVKEIGVEDNFFDLGGNSLQAAEFMNRLQEIGGEFVHIVTLFDHPTVTDLLGFLAKEHPLAISKMNGVDGRGLSQSASPGETTYAPVDAQKLDLMRGLIQVLPPLDPHLANRVAKNPRAVFVLSPPRSGSTLFRVMLAGNSSLFAPPELQLLCFNTLGDRKEAFSGRYAFWLEGLIRAVMQARQCGVEEARSIIEACEDQNMPTQEFYRLMQDWLGDTILVDKTPGYALDVDVLKRAEDYFEDPLYIHLIRHPYGMIRSFEDAKLEQIFKYEHSFAPRELAELMWLVSHQNTVDFLARIDEGRRYAVRFEELVDSPATIIGGVCRFLGIEFHPGMLEPHGGGREKMTDGIHDLSRMLGDIKFHQHKTIDRNIAYRWKDRYTTDFLGDITWRLAERLGYERRSNGATTAQVRVHRLPPLTALPRDGSVELPLSYIQQRLWFMDQMDKGLPAYNLRAGGFLRGALNVSALEQAISGVIRRHEVLRARFEKVDGMPRQFIVPNPTLALPVIDLRALPIAHRRAVATDLAQKASKREFLLEEAPLLRVPMIRLEDGEYFLTLSIHHIVSDGVTVRVFFADQGALYHDYINGEPNCLPDLPVHYADFSHWQREWLDSDVFTEQLNCCVKRLEGAPSYTSIMTDKPRPAQQTFNGAREDFVLSAELSNDLRLLARREGVTMFMLLMAAFKTLIHFYSGQEDILVAISVTNRTRAELEGMIGPVINNILIRSDFSGLPTVRDLLGRVRRAALSAYPDQHLPLERIIEELKPERDLSRAAYQDVWFNMEPPPLDALQLDGIHTNPRHLDNGTAKFELFFTILEGADAFEGWFEYNTDLYDATTIRRLLDHYEVILRAFVAAAGAPISALDILTPAESNQVLVEFNAGHAEYPGSPCLHHLFEAQADRSPERVAVSFEGEHLSYSILDKRANQIANYLISLAVCPETQVGICAERSLEMIAGLLGTLKSGAAFVPLDMSYPAERLKFMADSSGIEIVMAQQRALESLAGYSGKVVSLDPNQSVIDSQSVSRPWFDMSEYNAAYIVFTSGTTGRPKGAVNMHCAIVNALIQMQEICPLSSDDSVLRMAAFGFDFSVWEVFWPLLSGSRLVVAKPGGQRDNAYLADLISEERITTIHFVPSVLRTFLESTRVDRDQSLKQILCGGEAVTFDLQERFSSVSDAKLYNLYGPAEAAVYVSSWLCGERDDGRVPIGHPIANTSLYVLNRYLQPVPAGVPGELFIGGKAVARGYGGRPDLTAEKFIPNPFSSALDPDDRLYRTGDLARHLPDGNIEFLGRIDHQVKVRGFRIELAEIEAVMAGHPGVKHACAVADGDESGTRRILGYVVLDDHQETSVRDIREFLMSKLPDYMVPSVFFTLESIPLGPNGKVNTRALPRPDGSRPEMSALFAPPRTATEETIQQIWEEVLKIAQPGIHDNFFELGGHSLLIHQVLSRISNKLGVDVSVQAFFRDPTVAGLAAEATKLQMTVEGDEPSDADQISELLGKIEGLTDDQVKKMLESAGAD
jgi:amino acid adenylation domain-containing protein